MLSNGRKKSIWECGEFKTRPGSWQLAARGLISLNDFYIADRLRPLVVRKCRSVIEDGLSVGVLTNLCKILGICLQIGPIVAPAFFWITRVCHFSHYI